MISNDISDWSEVFSKCYLLNSNSKKHYEDLFTHLNNLSPEDGWFTENYGGCPETGSKKPFQVKNTRRLDAIRNEVDRLNLDEIEKCVTLTGLILGLDAVDNTIGHYSSYLAKWSPRSYKDLIIKVPDIQVYKKQHEVFKEDFLELAPKVSVDLAYLDPPYGSNNKKMPASRVRYAAYYHLWTTVVKNDKPALFGKVNRRKDSKDTERPSVFEEFRDSKDGVPLVLNSLQEMIAEVKSRYVLLSYSSGGKVPIPQMVELLSDHGNLLKTLEINYKKNVMYNMKWTSEWTSEVGNHKEYLFLLKKRG